MAAREPARHISHDPINNLKVRVCLKRVTSTSILQNINSAFANPTSTGQDLEMLPRTEEPGAEEVITISWQEKILSQREIEGFGDAINCTTVQEKKYHKMIEEMRERNEFKTTRIFTYTDSDPYSVTHKQLQDNETVSTTQGAASYLENKITGAKPTARKQHYTPLQHPVYVPQTEATRRTNQVQLATCQTMFIMADIGRARGLPRPQDEVVLCTLSRDSNKVLTVRPNFGKVYKADNTDQDVWEYTLEHITDQISAVDERREVKVMEELFSRHATLIQNMVGTTFTLSPEEGATRVHVLGEIARAMNFDADNLFVNYSMDLPVGWCVEEETETRGMTHRCRVKSYYEGDIAHFNHPVNLTLFSNVQSEETQANKPRLFVEIRSVDSWERVRLEGYAYLTLPATPGCYTFTLDTWRPDGSDNTTKLRRFFLGGTPELSDVTYTHIPDNYASPEQKTLLSKFGFKTISTGTVEIKVNIVHQTMPSVGDEQQRYKRVALKDKYGRPGAQMALLDAIETFSKARRKLEDMRGKIEPSLKRLTLSMKGVNAFKASAPNPSEE